MKILKTVGTSLVLFGVGAFSGVMVEKRFVPAAPCIVVIPNTPAFTLTETDKQERAQFLKDSAAAAKKNHDLQKSWLVP